MAPWKALVFGGGLVLGGIGIGVFWPQVTPDSPAPAEPAPEPAAEQDAPSAPIKSPTPKKRQQMFAAPQIEEQQRRLSFHNSYREFIAQAKRLDAAEREAQAARLAAEIDEYEARGELALSEALLLQTALIQATVSNEEEQKARADAIAARYRALSAARMSERESQVPAFAEYKQDERRIVEEVLAMKHIPDGVSRDEYLRRRLQEAREQAYQ